MKQMMRTRSPSLQGELFSLQGTAVFSREGGESRLEERPASLHSFAFERNQSATCMHTMLDHDYRYTTL